MNKNLQTTPRTKKAKLAWWNDLDKKWKELFIDCLTRELEDFLFYDYDELKGNERILTKRWNGFFKKENNSKNYVSRINFMILESTRLIILII